MTSHNRIEICGAIASGKTSLAARLTLKLNGSSVLENFRQNPFWTRFYAQPEVFQPEKDVCFLAQHTGEIKAATGSPIICDYAPLQDLAYARLGNDSAHVEMMQTIYLQLYERLKRPKLVVHLRCNTTELIRRIRQRGRTEEQAIDEAYLARLESFLSDLIMWSKLPTMVVHSDEINFTSENTKAENLLESISERISEGNTKLPLH